MSDLYSAPTRSFEEGLEDDNKNHTPTLETSKDNNDPMGSRTISSATQDTNVTQDTIIFDDTQEDEDEEDMFDENVNDAAAAAVRIKSNDVLQGPNKNKYDIDDDDDDEQEQKLLQQKQAFWMKSMSKKAMILFGVGLLAILVLTGILWKTKAVSFFSSSSNSASSDQNNLSLDDSEDWKDITPPLDQDEENINIDIDIDNTEYYSSDEDGTEQSYHDNHGPIVESGDSSPNSTTTTNEPSMAPTKFVTTGRGPIAESGNSSNNNTTITSSEPSMAPTKLSTATGRPTTATTIFPSSSPTLTKTQPTTFVTTPTITSVVVENSTIPRNTTTLTPTTMSSSSSSSLSPTPDVPSTTTAPSWRASSNTPSMSPTMKVTTTVSTSTPSAVRQNSQTPTTMPIITSVPTAAVVLTNTPTAYPTTTNPTQHPTQSNVKTLVEASDAFLQSNTLILSGEIFHHTVSDLVFVQQTDGALVLYRGMSSQTRAPSEILWSNNVAEPLGSYYTVLQGDGNIVTRTGTPQNPGKAIWASGSVSMDGMYNLVPNSESTGIELRAQGSTAAIWSSLVGIIRSGSTFCVVADVPYNDVESLELPSRMQNLPQDCEFAVHLGDIKNGPSPCVDSVYEVTKQSLWKSPIPTFIIIGDNEWNDCPSGQRNQGLGLWKKHFTNFESYWNHDYLGTIHRDPNRPENFAFVYKSTLFVGLNMVGGEVINRGEWNTRLTQNGNWVQNLIRTHVVQTQSAKGVILFGHAEPRSDHNNFFLPLEAFIRDELKNQIPVLYLHGDGHWWKVVHPFYGQSSFLGVMAEGRRTTLKVNADPLNFGGNNVRQAFTFEHIRW